MAHGITETDQMAYAGAVPWHSLGIKFDGKPGELMTASQAVQLAQLGWTVKTVPLFAQTEDGVYLPTEGVGVLRQDTNEILGIASEKYTPIQNSEMFSFFDNLVAEGEGFVETAGSIWGGKKVWVLARLKDLIEFKHGKAEEVWKKFVLLLSSHDGTAGLTGLVTPVRVVCNNTVMAALGNCSNKVSIRHMPNAQERLREARTLMNISTKYYEEFGKMTEFLSGRPVEVGRDLVDYFAKVFPMPPPKKDENGFFVPTNSNVVKELRAKAMMNFLEEEDRYGPDWLSALNAATGVSTHSLNYRNTQRGSSDEYKFDSLFGGKAGDMSNRAVKVALEMAK